MTPSIKEDSGSLRSSNFASREEQCIDAGPSAANRLKSGLGAKADIAV
jgi:hypothetical protein